ncbi:MAG: hypothetical protein ACRYGR_03420 [Janthinobacterium lividum]
MINLKSKYFLQLLVTSAISILLSTNVQSSQNLVDEDPEMQKTILASMMDDDIEFQAAIRASM